ncbi:MAG TPA: YbaK/EbsC family protein [Acidimicrobiales bacterium]|jgi:prolyl-tRNA editing enzyme YbaK/EbsC (Cys-tRNA(Pro) deacylase)
MSMFTLGGLVAVSASTRTDLLAAPTRDALGAADLLDAVGVVEIDPALSDTASTQHEFGLSMDTLANCVIVAGKREGVERIAACVVLATCRVNNVVKRSLDVRKASFLPLERAVELSGMEYGGITPIGLPESWLLLIDRRVVDTEIVVVGSGVRRSKLLVPGHVLSRVRGATIVDGLGLDAS